LVLIDAMRRAEGFNVRRAEISDRFSRRAALLALGAPALHSLLRAQDSQLLSIYDYEALAEKRVAHGAWERGTRGGLVSLYGDLGVGCVCVVSILDQLNQRLDNIADQMFA